MSAVRAIVFCLAAFGAAFYGIWAPVLRAYRSAHSPWVRAVTLASLLTFIEALVESTAESIFEGTLPTFFLFGLAALAIREAQREAAGSSTTTS